MKNILNNIVSKWRLAWGGYTCLVFFFAGSIIWFSNDKWFLITLPFFGIILTIYPTVLIFAQGRLESDRANRNLIQSIHDTNQHEIEVMQELFQKQIEALSNNTIRQITASQELTRSQIETIQKSTKEQIENYASQTSAVVDKLESNAIFLAELLFLQLDEKLKETNNLLSNAYAKLSDLQGYKLLRTDAEKSAQLKRQNKHIENLEKRKQFFREKFKYLKDYLYGE